MVYLFGTKPTETSKIIKRMNYQLIRSKRKTIGIQVKDGAVVVRAPVRSSMKEIEAFVERSRPWIEKHLRLQEEMKI